MPDKSLCFVVSRIGDEDSPDRIAADWLLEAIVMPVMASYPEFMVERADKLSHPGLIDAQVIERLLTAKIVIADLSGLNPNVFYEIGIRHMAQEPIIHMHELGERIPFDVSLYRSIGYSRARPKDISSAKDSLSKAVEIALSDKYKVENPVTNARGRFKLKQDATPEERVLMDQMSSLERRLLAIETRQSDPRIAPPVGLGQAAPYAIGSIANAFATDPSGIRVSDGLQPGSIVEHLTFGRGRIFARVGNQIAVSFDDGHTAMLSPSDLRRAYF